MKKAKKTGSSKLRSKFEKGNKGRCKKAARFISNSRQRCELSVRKKDACDGCILLNIVIFYRGRRRCCLSSIVFIFKHIIFKK